MKKWLALFAAAALLVAAVPAAGATGASETYFTVVFTSEQLPDGAEALVAAAGGTVTYRLPQVGVLQVRGGTATLLRLLRDPAVLAVGPSIPVALPDAKALALEPGSGHLSPPGDLYTIYQWDIKRVTSNGASWALDGGTGSHDVVVGVIDTGIYAAHPDLAANLLPGSKNFVPAGGFRGQEPYEAGDPSDVTDRHGHGTHVAGAIAGNGRIYGVGPNLGFRAYKVFGARSAFSEWIWAAMIAAADDGTDVINLSLGGYDFIGQVFYVDPDTGRRYALGNDAYYHVAIRRVVQYVTGKGTVVVASAGNDALNATRKKDATDYFNALFEELGMPFYVVGATFRAPGGVPGVVTVSATGPDDSPASYSTYGPGYVTVSAPGGDFRRRPQPGWWLDMNLSSWSPNSVVLRAYYVFAAGTSMAAPKASAVAALIVNRYGPMPPELVASLVSRTADDLGQTGYDGFYGYGLVNAYRALGGE